MESRTLITTAAPDYAAALPDAGRLGGLDVGTKTIGLATCDASWSFASPAHTIARTKFTADLAELKAWAGKERLAGLVIGLPLNMDGTDSSRTQSVRAFARNVAVLGLPLPYLSLLAFAAILVCLSQLKGNRA